MQWARGQYNYTLSTVGHLQWARVSSAIQSTVGHLQWATGQCNYIQSTVGHLQLAALTNAIHRVSFDTYSGLEASAMLEGGEGVGDGGGRFDTCSGLAASAMHRGRVCGAPRAVLHSPRARHHYRSRGHYCVTGALSGCGV